MAEDQLSTLPPEVRQMVMTAFINAGGPGPARIGRRVMMNMSMGGDFSMQELPARRINRITLNLICKLLELPDYQTVTSELKTALKVELFILCVRDFVRFLTNDILWSGKRSETSTLRFPFATLK